MDNKYLEKLNALDIPESAKKDILRKIKVYSIDKAEREAGLPSANASFHFALLDGEEKNQIAVAEIIVESLFDLGLLCENRVTVKRREDLVSQYVGQTAMMTRDALLDSLGGALLILGLDEIYTGDLHKFGVEAIETLLTSMEDYRDQAMVIIAGDSEKMKQIFEDYLGLKSCFYYRRIEL